MALFLAAPSPCSGQSKQPDPNLVLYSRLAVRSTLNKVGEPFVLDLSYDLNDLVTDTVEKGTAEERWDGTSRSTTNIDSPTLHLALPQEIEDAHKDANRESFLVREMLRWLVHPMRISFDPAAVEVQESDEKVGTYRLACVALVPPGGKPGSTTTRYCSDINGGLGAVMGDGGMLVRLDRFESYGRRQVPREIEISYSGRVAIVGHVTKLEAIESERDDGSAHGVSGPARYSLAGEQGVAAGMLTTLHKKEPSYPSKAKKQRISGAVVICAVIGKDGKMAALDTVASPDPLLSKAAMDAAKKWEFVPYKLHDQPTAVSTVIVVNFAMSLPGKPLPEESSASNTELK